MGGKTLDEHIEVTPAVSGGRPRIAGRRITVQDIVSWHERLGRSPVEIAEDYDVTLPDVHAALAYYFDHREERDRSIADDRAFAAARQQQVPSKLVSRLRDAD
jgi:uncharacterized protein (DUF433 family)